MVSLLQGLVRPNIDGTEKQGQCGQSNSILCSLTSSSYKFMEDTLPICRKFSITTVSMDVPFKCPTLSLSDPLWTCKLGYH